MININVITNDYIKAHHTNWSKIPDYPYRVSIIGGSRSGKTNYLRNYHQPTFINYNYMENLPLNQSINC